MAKCNILLIRHGQSMMNVQQNKDMIPDHAVELTSLGKEQANKAGEFLLEWLKKNNIAQDNITFWVSPYTRTRQTARGVITAAGLRGCRVKEDDMLVELQFGLFNNVPKAERPVKFPEEWARYSAERSCNGKFFARMPDGESAFDCSIRQKLAIDSMFRDLNAMPENDKTTLIVVSHGAALTCFRKVFFHYSYEWYAQEPNPQNCSIQLITVNNGNNTDVGYIYKEAEED